MNNIQYIAKTFAGLENVLAKELSDLGAKEIKTLRRGVQFAGDKKLLYEANYLCRTALRIIKPIATFKAFNEEQLYNEIGKTDWSEYMGLHNTFSIDGITSYSNITHSKYLAQFRVHEPACPLRGQPSGSRGRQVSLSKFYPRTWLCQRLYQIAG